MNNLSLFPHQKEAIEKLHTGSILAAGVGSGKSITALAYFYIKECGGRILPGGKLSSPLTPTNLYIITTARKRDTGEWESECEKFGLPRNGVKVTIDSWNNIGKYEQGIRDAFYIFDEQRVVGSGTWVKYFIKIARKNRWILLSATPGDTWLDYVPVFVANGFYKNRSEFLQKHAVYSRYAKFPKIDKFVECGHLEALRRKITVTMSYKKPTTSNFITINTDFDKKEMNQVWAGRWNPFEDRPIRDISETFYLMRKVANSDQSRIGAVLDLMEKHPKLIIFYNFDYELDILRVLANECDYGEWNGHRHDPLPTSDTWVYLVQYTAGAEGWNCIDTDAIVFYSQNYSYKLMTQAAGRIDRLNTPYSQLYYYTLMSNSMIDKAISKALTGKKNFNELTFFHAWSLA